MTYDPNATRITDPRLWEWIALYHHRGSDPYDDYVPPTFQEYVAETANHDELDRLVDLHGWQWIEDELRRRYPGGRTPS